MSDYPSNEIANLPSVASFDSTFSYAAWTPGTTVTLCNVPWTSDYRDIVRFASRSALNTYLDSASRAGPRISIDRMTYCRVGVPIRVNIPFAKAYTYNYLRVVNGAQPVTAHGSFGTVSEDSAQTFYYFITDIRYLAPNTTEIFVQLDVWQTFGYDVTFGNCYIERGHISIANENAFANNGRDYLTIPEGLDVGNEYVVAKTYENVLVDNKDDTTEIGVMVMSTTSLFPPYGTVDAPDLTMAQGSYYGGVPNGCDLYLFQSVADFRSFMLFMADKPWVTQGIVSITAASLPETLTPTTTSESVSWEAGGPPFYRLLAGGMGDGSVVDAVAPSLDPNDKVRDRRWLAQDWRNGLLPSRYANLKKFLTYPYTAVELTTYSATPIVLKPECMYGDDIIVIQKAFMGQPNPRIAYIPYKYNAPDTATVTVDKNGAIVNDGGEMFDFMTGIFDIPTFSVVNSGYLQYMASNRNAIAFQHSSADWSQQRALQGAGLDMNNTTRGIELQRKLALNSISGSQQSADLAMDVAGQRAIVSGANHAIGGVAKGAAGGPVGAVAGAGLGIANTLADLTITQNQIGRANAIANATANRGSLASQDAALQTRDSNFQYAMFAAHGDYQNAIASINAKVQDAKLIQPTTAGQLGGDVFNLAMFKWGVFAKVKTLQPSIMSAIGEYWLRYGYAVNRFGQVPPDFQCMTKFTYWKLRETYISSGPVPEAFRQALRGIFEKGVTVWSNADDIGMIDIADNTPKAGITL